MANKRWADEHRIGIIDGVEERIVKGLRDKFKGECSEVGMYMAMSRQADREGYPEIARVLEKIAMEEAEHAARFAEMLGEVVMPSTKENLEKMIAGEMGACKYKKDIADWAKAANLDAIHDSVHEMAKDEARHGMALEGMLKRYFNETIETPKMEKKPAVKKEVANKDETICYCYGVSKGEIIDAIKNGAKTVEAIGEETNAGTGCGGCKHKLQQLIDENK